MEPRQWRLFLSAVACFVGVAAALLANPVGSDVVLPSTTAAGLLYVFMAGQIVVINPRTKTVVKKIRTIRDNPAPFPNSCPGHPLQGTWNGLALGLNEQTIFATFSYVQQPPMRLAGLQDGVVVLNTTSQEVDAVIPIDGTPNAIQTVPMDGSVWVHSDSNGSLSVFSITPPYSVLKQYLAPQYVIVGAGQLLSASGMGWKGYKTVSTASGVYAYNVYAKGDYMPFINFPDFNVSRVPWEPGAPVYCPATKSAAFAAGSRRAFIACGRAPLASGGLDMKGLDPGIVQVDVDTDKPVGYWNVTADKLVVTPDEAFVLALDTQRATIHMLQVTPDYYENQPTMTLQWPDILLPENSVPDAVVFRPAGDYYHAYVSLVNSRYMYAIDFGVIIECGHMCPPNTTASALSPLDVGLQIRPGGLDTALAKRPLATGMEFVCAPADMSSNLTCHDVARGSAYAYPQMPDVQLLLFVEGSFMGNETLLRPIPTNFNCSAAPATL